MKAIPRPLQLGLATLLAALLSLATAACGQGSASGQLECEREGYPCSLADVPVEILERSNKLGDRAVAMLEEGASTEDVEAWLGEQPGIAELGADDLVVRFRLEGGREYWIFTKDALETRSPRRVAAAAPVTDREQARQPAFVVGPEREQKSALVLSPFLWDLGDEAGGLADILSGTRGYESPVEHLQNATEASREVDVGSFADWGAYQVIHVESHGGLLCKPPPCRGSIAARALSEAESEAAELGKLSDLGLGVGVRVVGGHLLVLTADFFRHHYPGGLDDTVVFFNSCKGFASEAADMADAIRGGTSVYLGWDGYVGGAEDELAAEALYRKLAEGHTVEFAHSKLGGLETTARGSQLILGERPAGGDLRIRDIVYVLHPESGQVLSPADTVTIEGEPRDGEDDAAPYLVQVDGMPAETASDALVHVSVDGVEAEPRPVSSGEPKGEDTGTWLLRGVIPLEYDLEEEKRVTFRAWVELPSGGESDHEIQATLAGLEGLGLVWRGEVTSTKESPFGRETVVAELSFTRKPSQDPKPKRATFVLTEATITWSLRGPHYACTSVAASPRTWRIPPERLDSSYGTPGPGFTVWNGQLVFDLAKKPVQYFGYVKWDAPERVPVAQSGCDPFVDREAAYSVDAVLLYAGPRDRFTTPDRKTISGQWKVGDPTSVAQSAEWKVRRVK